MKENVEKISVVIPMYKVEKYLKKCIESVLKQTYTNLEIILVDDGSPDKCGEICEEYKKKDSRIKVIHKENGGLSDARNKGIDVATGKYVTFIDSDDFIEENYIEFLYNLIQKYNADISIGSHKVIYNNRIIDKSTYKEFSENSEKILEKILYDDGVDLSAWGKLYKIKLFDEIRFPKGRLYEDSATTYKLIHLANVIAVSSRPIYNYVMRNNSISQGDFNLKKMELITSTNEMTDFIKKEYPDLEMACNRRMMWAYLSTLSQLAKSKKRNKEVEKQLLYYIKKNRNKVLKDKKISNRDKFGIYVSMFGFKFYRFIWNNYLKITKRS